MAPVLAVKRVFDPPADDDGYRVLVDRLWPRGLTKVAAKLDLWAKDLAPSHELRKEFHGGGMTFQDFAAAYRGELEHETARAAAASLRTANAGPMTLLYAAKTVEANHAQILVAWLTGQWAAAEPSAKRR